jgi:hypothetical protein
MTITGTTTAVPEETPWASPEDALLLGPTPAPAPAGVRLLSAEELVALALSAGSAEPAAAAGRVYAAADGSRARLTATASLLIERLKLRSDDFEASLALRIVEDALLRTPYPDGPWRWAHGLDRRRVRCAERRRRRAVRRRRSGRRLPDRGALRLP